MNPNTRTNCIEVLVNDAELNGLNAVCKTLGIAKSVFLRGLMNTHVARHGKPPSKPKESRACRGVGRPANRASQGMRRLI